MKKILVFSIFTLFLSLPVTAHANSGDFNGGVAVGSGYAGTNTAPTNGMIVQGNVGIGTSSPSTALSVNGTANLGTLQLNSLEAPLPPGGRITLSSTLPVPTGDVTGATTIYYLPFWGGSGSPQLAPIYNGSHWVEYNIGSSGLSFGLSSTNMPASKLYDVYLVSVSGTPTLCSMYWGGSTRSTTAGGASGTANASITQLNGLWVNNAAIAASNCYGGASGTTSVTIAQNQGTLLGTYYTTGNGSTQINFFPAGASGGSNNVIGYSNIYNRLPISSMETDSKASWTTTTYSWALSDGSTSQRVTFIDPIGGTWFAAYVHQGATTNSSGQLIATGVTLNGTGAPIFSSAFEVTANLAATLITSPSYPPQSAGLQYVQQMQYCSGGTCTFYANGNSQFLRLDTLY